MTKDISTVRKKFSKKKILYGKIGFSRFHRLYMGVGESKSVKKNFFNLEYIGGIACVKSFFLCIYSIEMY